MSHPPSDVGLAPTVAPSVDPPELSALIGTVIAGRYRVDGRLGEGGMGAVFDGHHLGLDRAIAIKVLRPEFVTDPQVATRFEREAQAVSRLEHRAIVQVFDVGTASVELFDRPISYLVMERLRGHELTTVLGKPLPPAVALGYLEQVLEGIAHAHTRGIVHRDLKPENIFVTEGREGGVQLKLVDFGIAKIVQPADGSELTQMGMIFGTPGYMSPEQATGSPIDGRTDLYSAGVILYEMLAGHRPFRGEEMMDVLRQHIGTAPPPIHGLDSDVEDLLLGLLEKDKDARTPSAEAALIAVRDTLADLAASAAARGMGESSAASGSDRATTRPAPGAAPTAPSRAGLDPGVAMAGRSGTAMLGDADVGTAMPVPAANAPTSSTERPRTRAPRAQWMVVAAAVGLVVMLGIWSTRDDDDDELEPPEPVAVAAVERPAVTDADLQAIDEQITAGKRAAAHTALEKLLEIDAEDARVHWRLGLVTGDPRRPSQERAAAFATALRLQPSLLVSDEHVDVLVRELERRTVGESLLDIVLEHGDRWKSRWIAALLDRKHYALPHGQRHRLLAAVRFDVEAVRSYDVNEHLCLDLWQAETTAEPCATYAAALEAMEETPAASFRRTLTAVEVPTGSPSCEGLAARRDALLEVVAGLEGDAAYVPADYASRAPEPQKKRRRRRRPFRRLFGGAP